MAADRGELRRTHSRLTIFDARTMDEYLKRVERGWSEHCRTTRRPESLRSRARRHRPDRRDVLCGRRPTGRDRNPAVVRWRAAPCPVARPSGRRLPGRHGRGSMRRRRVRFPSCAFRAGSRSRSGPGCLCREIRFCSSARRCCSSRRRSPVAWPPGGRYGLPRRRPCGRSDRTPAVTVLARDQRIPRRTLLSAP